MSDTMKTGIIAYHGSQKVFDKFSFDSLGTELPDTFARAGVFEYGWGLYFTSDKNFASKYAHNAVKGIIMGLYKDYRKDNPEPTQHLFAVTNRIEIEENYNLDKIIEKFKLGDYANEYKFTNEQNDWLIKWYEYLAEQTKGRKVLYTVNLSGDKLGRPLNLLSFEKRPANYQLKEIKQALKVKKIGISVEGKTGDKIRMSLENYYCKIEASNHSRSTTMFLKECGIDGMQTIDGMIYVIWNDDAISVVNKNIF